MFYDDDVSVLFYNFVLFEMFYADESYHSDFQKMKFRVNFVKARAEVYSQPCQTFKIEVFCR